MSTVLIPGVNRVEVQSGDPDVNTSPTFSKEPGQTGVFIMTRTNRPISIWGATSIDQPGAPGNNDPGWEMLAEVSANNAVSRSIVVNYNDTNLRWIYVSSANQTFEISAVPRYVNIVARAVALQDIPSGTYAAKNHVHQVMSEYGMVNKYADINHTHLYSAADHNHQYAIPGHMHRDALENGGSQSRYALIDHNPYFHHDSYNDDRYSKVTHYHPDDHAASDHAHDLQYANLNHNHGHNDNINPSELDGQKIITHTLSGFNQPHNAYIVSNPATNPSLAITTHVYDANFKHVMLEGIDNYGFAVSSWGDLKFEAFARGIPTAADFNSNEVGYISQNTNVAEIDFTGQHRSLPDEGYAISSFKGHEGLIVISSGKYCAGESISVSEAIPKVRLSTEKNDPKVFGVVSRVENSDENREYREGAFISVLEKEEADDRIVVNSLGEGSMWVTDINGNLENGDYITSSDLAGYGMKQDDDLLHNYTVAKITMDCDFDLNSTKYRCEQIGPYKRAFVGVTYHCG